MLRSSTVLFATALLSMPGVESRQLDHLTAFTDHKKKVQERRRERAGQSHPEAHYDKNHREGEYSQNCVDEIMRANKRSSTDTERVEAAKCKIIHKKVVEGESELREEAEGGSRYAQKMFGSYLHSARNDTSTAVQYWKQCADSGDLECNVNVGMAYLMGHHNLEPDHHLAFKYISDAAKKGDAIAQYNLGMILLEGLPEAGIAVDRKGGLSGLLKAAQQKHTKAMIQLALQMLSHGLKGTKDQRRQQTKGALRWLNEADKLGSLEATTELGMCFKYGRGVRVNLEKSFAYFRKAADEGEMVAQYELALMYIYDDEGGSEQGFDDVLARKWMKAAAEQGHSNAMHNYANILLNHEDKRRKKEESSREKDIELALSMYAAAATQGVPDSLFNLGAFHSNGKFGLEKNDTIACQYFGAGARLGSKNCREAIVQYAEKKKLPEAVFQVGRMLEEGSADGSVEPDAEAAQKYFEEAALLGSASAALYEREREERTAMKQDALKRHFAREKLIAEVAAKAKGENTESKEATKEEDTPAEDIPADDTQSCKADDGKCKQ